VTRLAIIDANAGRLVMDGLFRFHDTHGLHLADAAIHLIRLGHLPSFSGFARDALEAGWSTARVKAVLDEARHAISDSGMMDRLRRV